MSKVKKQVKKQSLLLLGLVVVGVALVVSGVVMKTRAAVIGEPGQRLDIVNNLYYRDIVWDPAEEVWMPDPAGMTKLGRFYGGYVVGYSYCSKLVPDGNNLKCNAADVKTATGFGMLYQPDAGTLKIAIPLDYNYCVDHQPECVPNGEQKDVMPWFSFEMTGWAEGTGHTYGAGHPIGYPGLDFPGYVSLEVRSDLNSPPLPAYPNE